MHLDNLKLLLVCTPPAHKHRCSCYEEENGGNEKRGCPVPVCQVQQGTSSGDTDDARNSTWGESVGRCVCLYFSFYLYVYVRVCQGGDGEEIYVGEGAE